MRATDTEILVVDAVIVGPEFVEKFQCASQSDSAETRRALDCLPVRYGDMYCGCPHCANLTFVSCGNCQAYNCMAIGGSAYHCQSCGTSGGISSDGIQMHVSRPSGDTRHDR
ncbi:hypothetical protein PQR66_27330 [Paraburkholderia agricolaris]|uniref:TerY-C metal binding domain-containing protein n=1 Tax=Paraburkholderia agricolaris TaxID=2152888 RepID=A0ABW8ZUV2_9BURK